jgi:hypothetical protein
VLCAVTLSGHVYKRVLIIVKTVPCVILSDSFIFFALYSLLSRKKYKVEDFDLKHLNNGVENIGGK